MEDEDSKRLKHKDHGQKGQNPVVMPSIPINAHIFSFPIQISNIHSIRVSHIILPSKVLRSSWSSKWTHA